MLVPRSAARRGLASLALGLVIGLSSSSETALAFAPPADTTAPGFAFHRARHVGVYDAYATLPDGNRVQFDGSTVELVADDGTLIRVLATLPGPMFPSFVLPDPAGTYALIGESGRGRIYKTDLAGGGASILARLDYAYDAVFEDARHVLLTASPCAFGCDGEIHRLDVATGSLTRIGAITGPSGPLALSPDGDLYYGSVPTLFPPPPAPILRWTRAQLSSGVLLDEGNATTFVPAIPPASSMRFDPAYGHLFVASPVYQGTSEIREFGPEGQLVASVIQSPDVLGAIEVLPTQGAGSLQAFQPPGRELRYRGTDYIADISEIRALRPRRPFGSTSGPGLSGPGDVTFRVRAAYPHSAVLVLVGLSSDYSPIESAYDTGTYLFHTGMDVNHIRRLTLVPTDANGDASFTFHNPGSLQGTRVLQALVRDPTGVYVGASTAAFN